MSESIRILEAIRLAFLRAELIERAGVDRWEDLFDMPAMRYYPELGQVYDTDELIICIVDEWYSREHGYYWRVEIRGRDAASGASMGVAKSEMSRLLADNNARLRKGE